jgi:hypothetical protein
LTCKRRCDQLDSQTRFFPGRAYKNSFPTLLGPVRKRAIEEQDSSESFEWLPDNGTAVSSNQRISNFWQPAGNPKRPLTLVARRIEAVVLALDVSFGVGTNLS